MTDDQAQPAQRAHRWGVFETAIQVRGAADPLRDVTVRAELTSPSGRRRTAPGFWDGGETFRVRFAPDEEGEWRCRVTASGAASAEEEGRFVCVPYDGDNPLYRHGPPRVSEDRTHLVHADGTPFFFLGDTVWNGPMRAETEEDWRTYVRTRKEQGFTAAMYVTTSWGGLPSGGPDGPSHPGLPERVETVNTRFYQRLDRALDALAEGGLVGVPVLLWAAGNAKSSDETTNVNPGAGLSEEDAILLARYQVARWHAHPVAWILNGDGRYTGDRAPRWHRIGQAVFGDHHDGAPVMLHPGGIQWLGRDFKDEPWVDVLGYQSGHRGTEVAWRWLAGSGAPVDRAGNPTGAENDSPARGWRGAPGKIAINLEPCYEQHNRMDPARQAHAEGTPAAQLRQGFQRFDDRDVRRALYWSLLITPTAGVTYGGHGVWGWDPGGEPPIAHPLTGDTQRWSEALRLPGAEQLRHLRTAFESIPWWTLRPDQTLVRDQPGDLDVLRTVLAARSEDGRAAVVYATAGGRVSLDLSRLAPGLTATWIDPRTGARAPAAAGGEGAFEAPSTEDWLLILR